MCAIDKRFFSNEAIIFFMNSTEEQKLNFPCVALLYSNNSIEQFKPQRTQIIVQITQKSVSSVKQLCVICGKCFNTKA